MVACTLLLKVNITFHYLQTNLDVISDQYENMMELLMQIQYH